MNTRSKCCIIGIPDHQAVIHVGGRIGASNGPAAFRRSFSKMSGPVIKDSRIRDWGDVKPMSFDVGQNHQRAAEFIQQAQKVSDNSLVVGGSHDHGYSQLLGIAKALPKKSRLGCVNIDAHLDVRKPAPLITSGSPFYLALESGILDPKRFIEFGIQTHCNGPELWKYVQTKKVKVLPFQKLRGGKAVSTFKAVLKNLASQCDAIVVSLDLDAAASAYAPGVSAPQAEGFTSMEMIEMVEHASTQKKVISLGIFELNPVHDFADTTARLAATLAYHFIDGKLN